MATTTFQGIVRSNGGAGKGNATPSVVTLSEVISFDPTAASATNVRIGSSSSSGETFVLPEGAVPVSFMTIGGATGGTNPTVDIGSSADDDGFFNEVDCDTKGSLKGADGALVVAGGISAATTVTGKVGASAATGGTVTGVFTYTVVDNGAES
jgi:hypothetical protein|tara:strand:+ start:99 stop:557 length:459 start_codon:yes stop_codon:yes gene_type:complete